jgi:hypothetical protein
MSYNLFLDKDKTPKEIWNTTKSPEYAVYNWIVVNDYDSFIQTITDKGLPIRISLCHDFCEEHLTYKSKKNIPYESFSIKTGYDCVVWLVEYCIDYDQSLPKWKVHSEKSTGKKNIEDLLENFDKYQKTIVSNKKNK